MQFVEGGSILSLNGQHVPIVVEAWECFPSKMPKRLVHLCVLVALHLSVQQVLCLIAFLVVRRIASFTTTDLESCRLHALAMLRRIRISEAHLDGGQPVWKAQVECVSGHSLYGLHGSAIDLLRIILCHYNVTIEYYTYLP